MSAWMDSLEASAAESSGMVKPGDASMAAPFTAREPSVAPVCNIIRQGRSTLVTTLQMFKILGLMCLSSAFSLSILYLEVCVHPPAYLASRVIFIILYPFPLFHLSASSLPSSFSSPSPTSFSSSSSFVSTYLMTVSLDGHPLQGIKLGDTQATVSGLLSAALFFMLSASEPRHNLSSARPHSRIFGPYVLLSLLGQFAVHLSFLILMYKTSLAAVSRPNCISRGSLTSASVMGLSGISQGGGGGGGGERGKGGGCGDVAEKGGWEVVMWRRIIISVVSGRAQACFTLDLGVIGVLSVISRPPKRSA